MDHRPQPQTLPAFVPIADPFGNHCTTLLLSSHLLTPQSSINVKNTNLEPCFQCSANHCVSKFERRTPRTETQIPVEGSVPKKVGSVAQIEYRYPFDGQTYLACPGSGGRRKRCDEHSFTIKSIFVSFDGACSSNGRPDAEQAIGVSFGEGHEMNVSKKILFDESTNQVAELLACLMALDKTEEYRDSHSTFRRVILKSDSAYVVRGITEWLPKWKSNGWIHSQGKPVANRDLWQRTDRMIRGIQADLGIKFQFGRYQGKTTRRLMDWLRMRCTGDDLELVILLLSLSGRRGRYSIHYICRISYFILPDTLQ